MMVEVKKTDITSVRLMMSGIKNGYPKVMTRSINKTSTNVQTHAVREIGKDINLKAGRIRQDFKIQKASWSNLSGSVKATGKPVGLISFTGTRQLKSGVSVKVLKSKPRVKLKHAFITTANRAKNVFQRAYKGPRAKVKPGFPYARLPRHMRFPIERLSGPRVEDVFVKPSIFGPVVQNADERLIFNLNKEIDYEFSKL